MTDAPLAASAAASGSAASAARQSTPASAGGRCRDTARTAMPRPARCAARALPTWPVPNTMWSRSSSMSGSSLTPSSRAVGDSGTLDACGPRYAGHRKQAINFWKYSAGFGLPPGGEQVDDLTDGWLPGAWLGYRQVSLDLVAVAAAVLVRDHVAGLGEVGDDAVSAALGDAQAGRDVAQPRVRVAGDVQQDPGVVGQEAPLRHAANLLHFFLEKHYLLQVANVACARAPGSAADGGQLLSSGLGARPARTGRRIPGPRARAGAPCR